MGCTIRALEVVLRLTVTFGKAKYNQTRRDCILAVLVLEILQRHISKAQQHMIEHLP